MKAALNVNNPLRSTSGKHTLQFHNATLIEG